MVKKIKFFCILFSLSINVLFAIFLLHSTIIETAKLLIHPITNEYYISSKSIHQYINSQKFPSESYKINFIRNWIYENSIHKIDDQHKEYAWNTPKVVSMLWKTHLSKKNHAHLSCGPRALAMKNILDGIGIQSRVISIFTDDNPQINSHTFLEVFNSETKKWELQDPDFNIYYIDIYSKEPIATAQLIWGNINKVVPISKNNKGWKNNKVHHLKEHYFEAMMYMNHLNKGGGGGEKSIILINTDRFNASKIFKKNDNLTFYEFANKHYKEPIFIENQGFAQK